MSGDALTCDHANENPATFTCHCPADCYCWQHTCLRKAKGMTSVERERFRRRILESSAVPPADMGLLASAERAERELAPRLELMRWAFGQPDVLSLLETLRAGIEGGGDLSRMLRAIGLGIDLAARERRSESAECEPADDVFRPWKCGGCGAQGGARGRTKVCPECAESIYRCWPAVGADNAGKDWFVPVGTKHKVGEVDYSQKIPMPTIDPDNPPRLTVVDVDDSRRPEWWPGGPDDFGGEDFACFTGSEEERAAVGHLIERTERSRAAAGAAAAGADALRAEKPWEGRTCAYPDCTDKATGETFVWGWGMIPRCDRHGRNDGRNDGRSE